MDEEKCLKSSEESITAMIVYILYLVSCLFGITAIVGLIIAYVNEDDAPEWLHTHYQLQIRTFWIGLLYFLISVVLMYVFIGFITLLLTYIWVVVRCAKGLKYQGRREAYPNPAGWFF